MNTLSCNWISIICLFMMGLMTMCSKDETAINTVPDVPLPANLIFNETIEGNSPFSTARSIEIGDWDYALQFVSSPVYRGTKSARFEIREDQPLVLSGKRSDVIIVKGTEGDITKNTWYSFAVYFPTEGFERDSTLDVISQWTKSGSPDRLLVIDDLLIFESGDAKGNKQKNVIGEVTKDKWLEFIFHFIHSHEEDGLVEIWFNGVKMINLSGGNLYTNSLPKWAIGINKSSFINGTSEVNKRIIYFDNLRVGDENATYEIMEPDND